MNLFISFTGRPLAQNATERTLYLFSFFDGVSPLLHEKQDCKSYEKEILNLKNKFDKVELMKVLH